MVLCAPVRTSVLNNLMQPPPSEPVTNDTQSHVEVHRNSGIGPSRPDCIPSRGGMSQTGSENSLSRIFIRARCSGGVLWPPPPVYKSFSKLGKRRNLSKP